MSTLTFSPEARHELKVFAALTAAFAAIYFLPVGQPRFDGALTEALELTKWYAREHVVLCLLPAFWIAGAIAAFVSKASVMRYLGPAAHRPLAYGVGSLSGGILAVCSCTILPLVAGIYRMGAGIGPATAFLYAGPAINVLAVIMTAKVLGLQLGVARAAGAIAFSIVIGLLMALFFRHDDREKNPAAFASPADEPARPLRQTAAFFGVLVGILVFSNWSSGSPDGGFFAAVHAMKWPITSLLAATLALMLWRWFHLAPWRLLAVAGAVAALALAVPERPTWAFLVGVLGLAWLTAGRGDEAGEWFAQAWSYTKQIVPLLLAGVLVAGFLLGRPGHEGIIPSAWVAAMVGGNSIGANIFAAVAGALMYFATLTEVPILQGLIGNGMGQGPALTLLLAGPALSLPSVIVINTIFGLRRTATYVALVVVMSTLTGWLYGAWAGSAF
ncbi:MAG: permease [Steroidobacteraceae bacterium]|jgi:hypothetical protein|nr:permease [Steroidobacteraceae bacterium]